MELGTIAIGLIILFLIYRFGIVKFAQTNMDRVIAMTDSSLEVMELEMEEKRTRKFGKIDAKLDDSTIKRSTASLVRAKLKNAGRTSQA